MLEIGGGFSIKRPIVFLAKIGQSIVGGETGIGEMPVNVKFVALAFHELLNRHRKNTPQTTIPPTAHSPAKSNSVTVATSELIRNTPGGTTDVLIVVTLDTRVNAPVVIAHDAGELARHECTAIQTPRFRSIFSVRFGRVG